jgi:hypothetical protein
MRNKRHEDWRAERYTSPAWKSAAAYSGPSWCLAVQTAGGVCNEWGFSKAELSLAPAVGVSAMTGASGTAAARDTGFLEEVVVTDSFRIEKLARKGACFWHAGDADWIVRHERA